MLREMPGRRQRPRLTCRDSLSVPALVDWKDALMEDLANNFKRERYLLLPSILTDPTLANCYHYACKRAESGTLRSGDSLFVDAPCAGGDPFMDTLLLSMLPQIEKCSGLELYPTYSYFRVCKHGDVLPKHTDRVACEISLTLCLGGDLLWPFWLEGRNGVVKVEMAPGDGVLYRGIECAHWRYPFEGTRLTQASLHYVDQHGPYADWKFNKRPATSSPLHGLQATSPSIEI
jgi:hypothetical protein